jgi:hypothetical protein
MTATVLPACSPSGARRAHIAAWPHSPRSNPNPDQSTPAQLALSEGGCPDMSQRQKAQALLQPTAPIYVPIRTSILDWLKQTCPFFLFV